MSEPIATDAEENFPTMIEYVGLLFGIGALAIGAAELSKHWYRFFP